jgi:purine-binding chemotaxis protein CheW
MTLNNNSLDQFAVFRLQDKRFAIPLANILRVVRMVMVKPVPGAPQFLEGIINLAGQIVPVIDLRPLVGLPKRSVNLSDRLLIAKAGEHTLAIIADEVLQILSCQAGEVQLPPVSIRQCTPIEAIIQQDSELIQVIDLLRIVQIPYDLIKEVCANQ